jgi:hypothetical protein
MMRIALCSLLALVGLFGLAQVAEAGRLPVPGSTSKTIPPNTAVSYENEVFRGGELARVAVVGDGSSLLLVSVYDQYGTLIDSRIGYRCTIEWTPIFTSAHTIKVTNLGTSTTSYGLATN